MLFVRDADVVVEDLGACFSQVHQMPVIVLYDKPSDYPDAVIARLFDASVPTRFIAKGQTLEEVRHAIPHGMSYFQRDEHDSKSIIGCFM